jgi:hypothetical protein
MFSHPTAPQPLMSVDASTALNNDGSTATLVTPFVSEVTAGADPSFDRGTVGIHVLPLGQVDLPVAPEVQRISVTTGAEDLDGGWRAASTAVPDPCYSLRVCMLVCVCVQRPRCAAPQF